MTARRIFNVVHWSSTRPEIEDAFRDLAPLDWNFVAARELSQAERVAALKTADALIVVNLHLRESDIRHLERCRVTVHQGVGTDNVDVEALGRKGIPLFITPIGSTDEVAEHAVLLMLALSRRLKEISAEIDSRSSWPTWSYRTRSRSMHDRPVGLVGFGRIGQAVAERLLAMKAKIHVYPGPGRQVPVEWRDHVISIDSVPDLCGMVDIISLHVPLCPETIHLLDGESLGRLPRGALVINTSRGANIDEAALVSYLDNGHLGGAGLDVLEFEPPPSDHPLLGRLNVIVTPHLASGTRESLHAKARSIIEQISSTLSKDAWVA